MKYVENSISPKKNQQTDALACVYEVVVPTRRNLYFSPSFINEFKKSHFFVHPKIIFREELNVNVLRLSITTTNRCKAFFPGFVPIVAVTSM